MEESENEGANRQLHAADVNRLAQELNDGTVIPGAGSSASNDDTGARPVDPVSPDEGRSSPSPEAATQGYKPLASEEVEHEEELFPPDVAPTVNIGGSPEEQAALGEEYRRDRR